MHMSTTVVFVGAGALGHGNDSMAFLARKKYDSDGLTMFNLCVCVIQSESITNE